MHVNTATSIKFTACCHQSTLSINVRCGFNCAPLTIDACSNQSNSLEVVRFLLDNGADVAVVDEHSFNVFITPPVLALQSMCYSF